MGQIPVKYVGAKNNLFWAEWDTAPTDGELGTGTYAGVAGKGALCTAIDTGVMYRNVGTKDNVSWKACSGASGSFTTVDEKTVTVVEGIITSIE